MGAQVRSKDWIRPLLTSSAGASSGTAVVLALLSTLNVNPPHLLTLAIPLGTTLTSASTYLILCIDVCPGFHKDAYCLGVAILTCFDKSGYIVVRL